MSDLIDRVRATTTFDPALNEEVALALGWQRRLRTGLGLNGRTPGRNGWVAPEPPYDWKPKLPRLIGTHRTSETIISLLALAPNSQEKTR